MYRNCGDINKSKVGKNKQKQEIFWTNASLDPSTIITQIIF